MKTKIVIETNIMKLGLSYFDEKDDQIYELEKYGDLDDFGNEVQVLFDAVKFTLEILVETMQEDLKDIWKRLDSIEEKLS